MRHENQALQKVPGNRKPVVSHLSLAERGFDRLPTRHLGPHQAVMERWGVESRASEWNGRVSLVRAQQREHQTRMAAAQNGAVPPGQRRLSDIENELAIRARTTDAALTSARAALDDTIARRAATRAALQEENRQAFREGMRDRLGDLPMRTREAKTAARVREARVFGTNPLLEMMAANAHPVVFAMRKLEQMTGALAARVEAGRLEQQVRNRRTAFVLERQAQRVTPKQERDALRTKERRHRRAFARARRDAASTQQLRKVVPLLRECGIERVQVTAAPVHERAYLRELEKAIGGALRALSERQTQAAADRSVARGTDGGRGGTPLENFQAALQQARQGEPSPEVLDRLMRTRNALVRAAIVDELPLVHREAEARLVVIDARLAQLGKDDVLLDAKAAKLTGSENAMGGADRAVGVGAGRRRRA